MPPTLTLSSTIGTLFKYFSNVYLRGNKAVIKLKESELELVTHIGSYKVYVINPAECALGLTDPDDFIFSKKNTFVV